MGQIEAMKTTIEISDRLLMKAKRLANKRGVTLRSLTEEGLRKVVEESSKNSKYQAKPVTYKGNGLSTEFRGATWDRIRQAAYENHGA